jgi:5,10-methylenetetrahydrofolate reductase
MFLQLDTLLPGAGNPQNWNRLSYVRNNPVRFNDPSGHDVNCPGKSADECGRKPPSTPTPTTPVVAVCGTSENGPTAPGLPCVNKPPDGTETHLEDLDHEGIPLTVSIGF